MFYFVCCAFTYLHLQISPDNQEFSFQDMDHFDVTCMECYDYEHVHNTLMFNAFVFAQIFNEFNARSIFDEVNIFRGGWRSLAQGICYAHNSCIL